LLITISSAAEDAVGYQTELREEAGEINSNSNKFKTDVDDEGFTIFCRHSLNFNTIH